VFGGDLGSAHNQYVDVLFRIGLPLFVGYIYFAFIIVVYCYNSSKGLFVGVLGVFVYGLFHETFKEPHGAFVFATLLSLAMNRMPKHRA
jgi:O-antigen ligase